MKKDIEWLKDRFKMRKLFKPQTEEEIGYNKAIDEFSEYVDQLDEPEVEQLYKKIRNVESFNDFLIRSNNQLRNELDNQEVLSPEWIGDNVEYAHYMTPRGTYSSAKAVIDPDKLKKLLVPKQEITEEQAYKDGYHKGIELKEVMNIVYEDGELIEKMKPLIAVKDNEGNVYAMPSNTSTCILEITYSTSYYQFEVQDTVEHDNGTMTYPQKTIIVPINTDNWVDFLAVDENEIGELVEEWEK